MAEYIDRQELLENLNKFAPEHYSVLVNTIITKQPAADVVEVKHGYWIKFVDECDCEYIECSCCGNDFYDGDNDTYDILPKYCCECGAKMDGERKE